MCSLQDERARGDSYYAEPFTKSTTREIRLSPDWLTFLAIGPVVLLLELFNSSGTVDVLHRSCVERVTGGTDINLKFLDGASSLESVAAAALNFSFVVIRVDVFLHNAT